MALIKTYDLTYLLMVHKQNFHGDLGRFMDQFGELHLCITGSFYGKNSWGWLF